MMENCNSRHQIKFKKNAVFLYDMTMAGTKMGFEELKNKNCAFLRCGWRVFYYLITTWNRKARSHAGLL